MAVLKYSKVLIAIYTVSQTDWNLSHSLTSNWHTAKHYKLPLSQKNGKQ